MPAISPTRAQKRAHVAGLAYAVQAGKRTQQDLDAARRELAYEGLAEHAARVVADWPEPSQQQLARIAAILSAGGAA